ncbi:MAG: hypothetical protein ACK501_13310 [Planctomycetota bacterium]
MTAVFGILVGIIGGVAALMFTAMFGGLLLGFARGIRESRWPGLPVAVTAIVWMIATALLIASLPVMLGAWMADADQVLTVAGRIAGYCFWPALAGFPLCLWIGGSTPRSYDAG